jgi:hypothetical protein
VDAAWNARGACFFLFLLLFILLFFLIPLLPAWEMVGKARAPLLDPPLATLGLVLPC